MTEDQHKTTIILPEELYERVKQLAYERGESMGHFIRDAVADRANEYGRQPRPMSIGIGDSGRSDISQRIDELYDPEL